MLQLSHKTLISISGLIWLTIGFFLLSMGLNFLVSLPKVAGFFPLLGYLASYGSMDQAAIWLIAISLFLGYLKGRYVLGKSAEKGVQRIRRFPNPTSLANIYSAKYYILLGVMIALGLSIKFLGLPNDIRGVVDVTIGSALINGGMCYFRMAFTNLEPVDQSEK